MFAEGDRPPGWRLGRQVHKWEFLSGALKKQTNAGKHNPHYSSASAVYSPVKFTPAEADY
jgi:hypothetical protein